MADVKKARLYQTGNILDWTNGGDTVVTAGSVVVAGTFVGIVQNDIPAKALGAIAITGVWEVAVGGGATFAQGAPVYWNTGAGYAAASGGVYMGRAAYATAEGDDTVKVRLEPAGDAGYANAG
ncbi:MAG: DUF2190 family protein [Thermoguttaceae bacterium]|nr:DUF2190 family protein [Thermoguttaceae bacterium]